MLIGLSGVQLRVVTGEWFEFTGTINPELYDTKSFYQLIVSITKCEKLRN